MCGGDRAYRGTGFPGPIINHRATVVILDDPRKTMNRRAFRKRDREIRRNVRVVRSLRRWFDEQGVQRQADCVG